MSSDARNILAVIQVSLLSATFAHHDARATAAALQISSLTSDGQLTSTLAITDQQAGFVGVEGLKWSIDPDGGFRVVRFVNESPQSAHQQGQLTLDELKSLGALLDSTLPRLLAHSGQAAPVNAHTLVIQFGCRTWTLHLPPGQTILQAQEAHAKNPDGPEALFLRVVRTITSLVDHDER
jgi:hypothetical protein